MSTSIAGLVRGRRDRLVNAGFFLFAVGFGVLLAMDRLDDPPLPVPTWMFLLDLVAGALGCVAVWWRRRRPVAFAVTTIALSTFSELIAGPMLVALFTVAVHRSLRTTMAVFGLSVAAVVVYLFVRPDPGAPSILLVLMALALHSAAVGWGVSVHNRRSLLASLEDRAARAENEARLCAEQAQHEAREALAREIHDVLGHRLSLLSVHAGALQYHPDASPQDVARAAEVIRENAHRAMQDLREVIGVLRAPVGELPQPTIADVAELVEESRRAGMEIELAEQTCAGVPETAGRTVYRVVQEGLTNARKHAPGAAVTVRIRGAPGRGLAAEIVNTEPAGSPPAAGPGRGLIGLAERAALTGGRLEHGPCVQGGWRLAVWIPWPA